MKNRALVIALAMLVLMLLMSACTSRESRTTRDVVLVHAQYPAYTDSELVEKSDAIVLVKVSQKGGLYREDRAVFTEFEVQVLDAFKGNLHGPVTVTWDGSDREVFVENPLPTVGQEVILFLHRVPENGRFVLLNGGGSRFDRRGTKFSWRLDPEKQFTLEEFERRFSFNK